ncbi:MAG: hypothetical protein JAZ17_14975 [Candidatus Thiodiazotropha endolucinida]|nr:hypothetical protein [Candidatus Thiodiazotropha endolucinida]
MQIIVDDNSSFLPPQISQSAIDIVGGALQSITTMEDKFVVNDTLYYRETKPGKFMPCVANSAYFLSSKFQAFLDSHANANGETTIKGESIDGLITLPYQGLGQQIADKNRLLEVLHGFIEDEKLSNSSIYTLFPVFYGMFVERSVFNTERLQGKFQSLFKSQSVSTNFRIGVEFETGNIASSFRALNKLYVLFQKGEIEAGILVTSIDKARSSTRIWPQTNRNGSLQELKSRKYKDQVSFPLISIGFAPDGFSEDAPLLGRNGELLRIHDTGEIHSSGIYKILKFGDEPEILLPL